MADFVRQHIRLRKLPRRAESLPQLIIEAQIYVNLLIFGTIKGPVADSAVPHPDRV